MSQLTQTLLNSEIHQKITAQLKLPNYNQVDAFIPGRDSYSVLRLSGETSVVDNYSYTLTFLSDEAIPVEDIVDTEAELSLRDEVTPLNSKKIFGKIIDAREEGSVARKKLYEIRIVSPVHYLSLNQRYEIFQDKNVPDIISEIIGRYGVLLNLQLEVKIDTEELPKRHTCTQYAQSDLAFIRLLCEEEGYVLLTDPYKNDPYSLILCELNEHAPALTEAVECSYNLHKEFSSSAQVQDYYEEKKPSLDFTVQAGSSFAGSSLGDNETSSQLRSEIKKHVLRDRLDKLDESLYKDLVRYAKIDAEAGYAHGVLIQGHSEGLAVSHGLSLQLDDRKAHKSTEAIILSTKITASFPNALDEYTQAEQTQEAQYRVEFDAIPKGVIYKPQKLTAKPRINSIQTAIVSNANEETSAHANEIDVNAFGEIRVIFHFDQKRPTSCYIPVSNIYSGDGYGTQFLPRVNSEVIISYINGDIDRPVITGSLHNGENRHPYNLPKEKTKSFIKTQTTPQYEDKEGYNELLFEDKQGEELLSLRAQKDYQLNVLNDAHIHIENNSKTVIDNDKELTIANDYHETVGNDKKVNIVGNNVAVVEKEQLTTVKADQETHVLGNVNTIIRKNKKNIIEKDLIERIKGSTNQYVEKDAKEKYLQNLYLQISQTMGIDVTGAYHLNASSIKQKAKTIELEATDGISLKCGGNVLTVDASGIHLKAAVVDTASGNGGVSAAAVTVPKIEKPVYNKLRVTSVAADSTKQNDIKEVLTYTASVEKYENGAWTVTTELTQSQEAQIQWVFIKNNDKNDIDILTDNATNDTIVVKGLEMSVTIEDDNIYKYGHAHCFVVDADDEGYAVTELKRYVEVVNIIPKQSSDSSKVECTAVLNIDEPKEDELAQIRWNINGHEKPDFNALQDITYDLNDEKVREVPFKAYIETRVDQAALIIISEDVEEEEDSDHEVMDDEEL